ncbi:unnamed protein product, partial [Rotaria magnacalcarata]
GYGAQPGLSGYSPNGGYGTGGYGAGGYGTGGYGAGGYGPDNYSITTPGGLVPEPWAETQWTSYYV